MLMDYLATPFRTTVYFWSLTTDNVSAYPNGDVQKTNYHNFSKSSLQIEQPLHICILNSKAFKIDCGYSAKVAFSLFAKVQVLHTKFGSAVPAAKLTPGHMVEPLRCKRECGCSCCHNQIAYSISAVVHMRMTSVKTICMY